MDFGEARGPAARIIYETRASINPPCSRRRNSPSGLRVSTPFSSANEDSKSEFVRPKLPMAYATRSPVQLIPANIFQAKACYPRLIRREQFITRQWNVTHLNYEHVRAAPRILIPMQYRRKYNLCIFKRISRMSNVIHSNAQSTRLILSNSQDTNPCIPKIYSPRCQNSLRDE